jgi:hypothetical protein
MEFHAPRCKHSGGHPCSQSRARAAAASSLPCPDRHGLSSARKSGVSRGANGRGKCTLKARCSRKCAVPLVSSVSDLEPASIQTPTVDVWAQGEYSVATCGKSGQRKLTRGPGGSNGRAHGQAILERRGLGLRGGGRRHGGSKASAQGAQGRSGSSAADALSEVQS